MKRSGVWLLVTIFSVLALVSMGALAVFAASPHFRHGGVPTCKDTGLALECTGALAGLGNQDVVITLDAPGEASFNCVNPGGNESPGQNKVPFEADATVTIAGNEIKNGNLTFIISAPQQAPTATAEQAGCPNPNWSTRLTGVDFPEGADLTISQGGVLLFTCSTDSAIVAQPVTLICN